MIVLTLNLKLNLFKKKLTANHQTNFKLYLVDIVEWLFKLHANLNL